MRLVSMDFEYIENKNKTFYYTICASIHFFGGETYVFDLLDSVDSFQQFLHTIDLDCHVFAGFAIAGAEIPVLCQIVGREFVSKMKWIDLWVEFKMFSLTHPDYYCPNPSLKDTLNILKINDKYSSNKEEVRNLILFSESQKKRAADEKKLRIETDEFYYTDEEKKLIQKYCIDDTRILEHIYYKIEEISKKYPIEFEHRVYRGEHCKFLGISYYYHKGFPMDVEKLRKVFENIPEIKIALQEKCNEQCGIEIYVKEFKGPQRNKVFVKYSFSMKNFITYVKSKGLYEKWEKTKTGLKLEEDYLDEMLSQYRVILEPIYNARNTIKQLNSTNLITLLTDDDYIKSFSFPNHQKTSRDSPKPKLGFILNLTPWLRMLIKPKPGRAFVSIDFTSQEVLIAACLSMDDAMLADYLTDIYLGQAIRTGFAPEGATKKTHAHVRKPFKPIVLGNQFGMREKSLAIHFFNMYQQLENPKTLIECERIALKYLNNLEKAYYKYYSYLKQTLKKSRANKYYKNLDNWFYFLSRDTRDTQLINVPCQSNGAAMTRLAHDKCVERGIDVIMLHDSLSFECDEKDAVKLASQVSKIMCNASAKILGFDFMQSGTKIYYSKDIYFDSRGEEIYRFIMNRLNLECQQEFQDVEEIKNIHLNPQYNS